MMRRYDSGWRRGPRPRGFAVPRQRGPIRVPSPEEHLLGWNLACPRCGSIAWAIWSRYALDRLPPLQPIAAEQVDAARLAERIAVEVACLGCLTLGGAYGTIGS